MFRFTFGATLLLHLLLTPDVTWATPPSVDSPDLIRWNYGRGYTYRYRQPTAAARKEWQEGSAIAKDLTDLNLISLPPAYKDKAGSLGYPLLDALQIDYGPFERVYSLSSFPESMLIWTYSGYDLTTLQPSSDFEFKISPPLMDTGKYDKTRFGHIIKLPRVSGRIARVIFPNKSFATSTIEHEDESFWPEVFNSNVPIIITEGHKKALSILSTGLVAVGMLGGCRGFEIEQSTEPPTLQLAPEIKALFASKQRLFYINFDYDPEKRTRAIIRGTTLALAQAAISFGHQVRIVQFPDSKYKGADDFIVKFGAKSYRNLIRSSLSFNKFSQLQTVPSITIQSMFKEYLETGNFQHCFKACKLACQTAKKDKATIKKDASTVTQ